MAHVALEFIIGVVAAAIRGRRSLRAAAVARTSVPAAGGNAGMGCVEQRASTAAGRSCCSEWAHLVHGRRPSHLDSFLLIGVVVALISSHFTPASVPLWVLFIHAVDEESKHAILSA